MAHTYEELKEMTVAQLRDIAKGVEHEELKGYSTMHKEKLLPALCHALGVVDHPHHRVVGVNKSVIKTEIRQLKAKRAVALESGNRTEFKAILKRIHRLKRVLRRSIV